MSKVFIFALGAAAGSLVTWKLVEEKYKRIADEEIESVIEQFKEREKSSIRIDSDGIELHYDNKPVLNFSSEPVQCTDVMVEEYKNLTTDYSGEQEEEGVIKTTPAKERIIPYVISPDEFGEYGNEIKSLIYYADGILADDDDMIVSDPNNVIGDALSHFGDFEEDAVHVRDENIECDYEILRSEKTFGEVYKEEN